MFSGPKRMRIGYPGTFYQKFRRDLILQSWTYMSCKKSENHFFRFLFFLLWMVMKCTILRKIEPFCKQVSLPRPNSFMFMFQLCTVKVLLILKQDCSLPYPLVLWKKHKYVSFSDSWVYSYAKYLLKKH